MSFNLGVCRRWALPSLLVLGILVVLALMALPSAAQTPPPASGDWVILDATTVSDRAININGSVTIQGDGMLTLVDVDLTLTSAPDGSIGIVVTSGSRLLVKGGSIASANNERYHFMVMAGGHLTMENTTVTGMWQSGGYITQSLGGGLQVYSDHVRLTNCTFTRNERMAIFVKGVAPKFFGCTFDRSAYYTWTEDGSYIRDAYGIVVIDGSPEIVGCTFSQLGDYDTAFDDWPPGDRCTLILNGHGILIEGGSPTIRDCIFRDIGRVSDQISERKYFGTEGRYVTFWFTSQSMRACIKVMNARNVRIDGCNFTGNYQGLPLSTNLAYLISTERSPSTVTGCTFVGNNCGGLWVWLSDIVFRDSVISDFRNRAIKIDGIGALTIANITINGTGGMRPATDEVGVEIWGYRELTTLRELRVSYCSYAFRVYHMALDIYDSNVSMCTMGVFLEKSRVDLFNVTLGPWAVELGLEYSVAYFHDLLGAKVTWQNGAAVPRAQVSITSGDSGTILEGRAGQKGILPEQMLVRGRINGTVDDHTIVDNSLLTAEATSTAGLTSGRRAHVWRGGFILPIVIRDDDLPELTVLFPKNDRFQSTSDLEVRGTASDNGSGLYQVKVSHNGMNWTEPANMDVWVVSLTLADGIYIIYARVVDTAGNVVTAYVRNVTIDTAPPLLEVHSPNSDRGYNRSRLTVQCTATDEGSGVAWVKVSTDGMLWKKAEGRLNFSIKLDLADGVYDVHVKAMDVGGNSTLVTVTNVTVDTEDPVAVAGEDVAADPGDRVTLDGSGSHDNIAIYSWEWSFEFDGEPVTVDGPITSITLEKPGEYDFTLTVVDMVGHASTDQVRVTVLDLVPPEADAGDAIRVGQGREVTFDGSASTDNVGIMDWTWTFEENGETIVLEGMDPKHSFDLPGLYNVTLTVTDAAGHQATDEVVVTVRDTIDPKAVAGEDVVIEVGTTMVLDGANSTDNVGIVSYAWKISYWNGTWDMTGMVVSFAFEIITNYTVKLVVTDGAGNSNAIAYHVDVTPEAEEPDDKVDDGPGFGAVVAVLALATVIMIGLGRRNR